MSDKYYTSFLICFHPEAGVTNLFHEGLPIGVIDKNQKFTPHHTKLSDGTLKAVKLDEQLVIRVSAAVQVLRASLGDPEPRWNPDSGLFNPNPADYKDYPDKDFEHSLKGIPTQ